MDHVEKDPYGPWLVVSVGIIDSRRYKPKIQRLHRWRGALPAGVRPGHSRSCAPLISLLLTACGAPAEQQDEPPCPQHGSEKSSSVLKEKTRKVKCRPWSCYSPAGGEGKGGGTAADTCPSLSAVWSSLQRNNGPRVRTFKNIQRSRLWQPLAPGFPVRTHYWHLLSTTQRAAAAAEDEFVVPVSSLSPAAG